MCDGMLVVFSSWQGALSVFHLESKPKAQQEDPLSEPLAWETCAMPSAPPQPPAPVTASQKSTDTLQHIENCSPNVSTAPAAAQPPGGSRLWQRGDLQQSGVPELGTATLLSAVCTVSKASGEVASPQSSDRWSSLCSDCSRRRCLLVLNNV